MHLLGIELFEPDGNNMLYDDIFELTTIEEIESWLNTRIVSNMIETLSVREESQYKNISEKIVHIIQQEFDTDLTLESIAGRLHYNPNYLSKDFQKRDEDIIQRIFIIVPPSYRQKLADGNGLIR